MKTKLKPSAREKKRYLLLEINSKVKDISTLIKDSILDFSGTLGYSKASPEIIKINKNKKTNKTQIILAINRKSIDEVKAAICVSKTQILVKKVSGILKKLKG